VSPVPVGHDHVAYRRERIAEASTHQAGWYDGDGDPITETALAAAQTISDDLAALAPDEHWYVAGTSEGGMRFEATRTPEETDNGFFHCTTIEIQPDGDAYVHCLAVDRDSDTTDGAKDNESGHIETDPVGCVEKTLELRDLVINALEAHA
jgi:hypothetical protein